MKTQKRLNLVLIFLIVLLLSLISFFGIYYQDKSEMVSRIPEYILGTDLTGYRKVTLKPADDTASESTTKLESVAIENATQEETKSEENNHAADYEKAADVIRNRFKYLKLENYTVSVDKNTGKIDVTLPEKEYTDTILSDIVQKGNFTIKDTDTSEVLMTNKDIKGVDVGTTKQNGTTYIAMNVNFTASGSSKLQEITKTHQNVLVENAVNETEAGETQEDGTVVYSGVDEASKTPTYKAKKVTLYVDDTSLMETEFSEIIDNGTLTLSLGTSEDAEELKTMLWGGKNIGAMIANEAIPLQYSVSDNVYVASTIDSNSIKALVYVEIAIALAIALVMILKFRLKGIMQTILSIGYLAILLLVVRYANVVLSFDGIIALGIAYLINSVFGYLFCTKFTGKELSEKESNKTYKELMKKYALIVLPELVLGIIGALNGWAAIFSLAMCIFWGVIISYVYNAIFAYFVKNM